MMNLIPFRDRQKNGLALIQRELKVVQLLLEISQALNQSLDLEEAMRPVLGRMAEDLVMTKGSITLLNRKTGEVEIDLAYGLSGKKRSRYRYKSDEGGVASVVETGIPAIVEGDEPHFLNKGRFLIEAGGPRTKREMTFICVPIQSRDETIGAISADRLFPDDISVDEGVRLLTTISSLLAQAIEIRREAKDQLRILQDEKERLQSEFLDHLKPVNIIGNSHAIRKVFQLISQASSGHASILITGENGVGKELAAQAIHVNSQRADKPFIKVNLAALQESMIENELFGRGHGTFRGLIRKGCFEMANGGTLFLDEVSHLPSALQVRLLRAIQEKEFERPGGNETIKVDVRIISATSSNLEELVQKSQFRQDLFYRLNLFPIFVPPLRERKTDIPLLVNHFVEKAGQKHSKTILRISSVAINLLMNYHWPGNIRELENCIERAVLLSTDGVIHGHHLPSSLQIGDVADTSRQDRLRTSLAALEQEMIVDALMSAHGNAAKASRFLGVSGRFMSRRFKKFGINSKHYKQISDQARKQQ